MAHGEVVSFIKSVTGDTMEMTVERGEIVVPNITDCFPVKSEADLEKMTEEERKLYWQEAMKAGLGSRLGPKHFTTVGKMKVHYAVFKSLHKKLYKEMSEVSCDQIADMSQSGIII